MLGFMLVFSLRLYVCLLQRLNDGGVQTHRRKFAPTSLLLLSNLSRVVAAGEGNR
jgi:hypothetical protein